MVLVRKRGLAPAPHRREAYQGDWGFSGYGSPGTPRRSRGSARARSGGSLRPRAPRAWRRCSRPCGRHPRPGTLIVRSPALGLLAGVVVCARTPSLRPRVCFERLEVLDRDRSCCAGVLGVTAGRTAGGELSRPALVVYSSIQPGTESARGSGAILASWHEPQTGGRRAVHVWRILTSGATALALISSLAVIR
jgi:hypothetical protein